MRGKGVWFFKLVKGLVKIFYPKIEIVGTENLPDGAAIVVGNHTQMNGPIISELYFPDECVTWCAGQMMHLKDVPDYAYTDFWSGKPKYIRWFFKVLSYIIAPLSVVIFNNAKTIAVYRDSRILSTFKATVAELKKGKKVIIFPEHDKDYNHILCDFQDRFIDVAKLYFKKSGEEIPFVPMYIAPALRKVYIGKPIYFNAQNPTEDERRRICDYLMKEITEIAVSLPEHTVVPYRNIPRKFYVKNIKEEDR